MDISTILNPPCELHDRGEPMEVDEETSTSPTIIASPYTSPTLSASEFPSPLSTDPHSYQLPSMDQLPMARVENHPPSGHSLPPLRALFQDIRPSSTDRDDFCSQIARTQVHHEPHASRQASRRTKKTVREFQEYEQHAGLSYEYTPSHNGRRRSHHSSTPSRPAHHSQPQYPFIRRRSHPSSVWNVPIDRLPGDRHHYYAPSIFASDHSTHYDSSSPPESGPRSSAHNNKAYTKEMVHWIRYHAVDRGMQFKALVPLFFEQFPERRAVATHQILTARYYRDNERPALDAHGRWGLHTEGKFKGQLKMVPAPVRQRNTAEGREIDFPFTLVDKWPERVLEYEWKEPILEEDKERARRILAGDDPSDPFGKKAAWRRILKECEEHIYKSEI